MDSHETLGHSIQGQLKVKNTVLCINGDDIAMVNGKPWSMESHGQWKAM
jgi:hypothetical protein